MQGSIEFRVIATAILLGTAAGCGYEYPPTFVGDPANLAIPVPAKHQCTAIDRETIPECDTLLGKHPPAEPDTTR